MLETCKERLWVPCRLRYARIRKSWHIPPTQAKAIRLIAMRDGMYTC